MPHKRQEKKLHEELFCQSYLDVPFECFLDELYTADTLYKGYEIGVSGGYSKVSTT